MSSELETQTNVEGKRRKRLTPLLRKLLNDNSIPDLCWRDRARQIWQMPWKHHKQTKWGDHDALMLRELAKVMYNYHEAAEPAQERLKQWKELFRNALRSLKDVKELKELHVTDGERPYKVYQFVDSESGRVKRGRSKAACQSRDNEKERNNSSESSNSISRSNLYQQASNIAARQLAIPTQLSECGIVFRGQPSQLVNVDSTSKEECNVRSQWQHQRSPLSVSADTDTLLGNLPLSVSEDTATLLGNLPLSVSEDTATLLGNLADCVDDNTLNKLMSEFSLGGYRSRSPLRHNNEAENDMDIHEVSVSDIEIFNNGTLNNIGMGDGASATTVNSPPKRSPYDWSQQCIAANEFTEATLQNLIGNYDGNKVADAESHAVSRVILHRLQNVERATICQSSPAPCIQNTTVQNQNDVKRDEFLPDIKSHRFGGSILSNKSLLSCQQTNQQSYPSISSILSNAPAASVFVVVYYNMYHVVKWQIFRTKFRVCFVPDDASRESMMTCQDPRQFGPTDVDLLELPEITKDTGLSLQARGTNKVLSNLTRGIIVDPRDKEIYATRYCKAVPHFCSPGRTEFTKMERLQEVKIFDFHDYFRHSFDPQYRYQNADPHVRLSFAVKDANKKIPALSLDIWFTAAYQAKLQTAENAHSLEADCSLSDEYDRRVETEHLLKTTVLQF